LVLDKAGNLYAATAEAGDVAAIHTPANSATEKVGRPQDETGGVPIPSKPPENPKPPQPPAPGPGEPAPIPKKEPEQPKVQHPMHLLLSAPRDPNDPISPGDDEKPSAGPTTQKSPPNLPAIGSANAT